MTHQKCLEVLSRKCKDLRDNTSLMAGALLILSGDFRQTLPVIPKSTPADEIIVCLKIIAVWQHAQTVKLTTNMRAQISGDVRAQDFFENLLRIGEGTNPINKNFGQIVLTNELCNFVETPEQFISGA